MWHALLVLSMLMAPPTGGAAEDVADAGTGGKFFGQDVHNAGDAYHNHALDDEPPPSQVAGRNAATAMAFSGIEKKKGMLSY